MDSGVVLEWALWVPRGCTQPVCRKRSPGHGLSTTTQHLDLASQRDYWARHRAAFFVGLRLDPPGEFGERQDELPCLIAKQYKAVMPVERFRRLVLGIDDQREDGDLRS